MTVAKDPPDATDRLSPTTEALLVQPTPPPPKDPGCDAKEHEQPFPTSAEMLLLGMGPLGSKGDRVAELVLPRHLTHQCPSPPSLRRLPSL